MAAHLRDPVLAERARQVGSLRVVHHEPRVVPGRHAGAEKRAVQEHRLQRLAGNAERTGVRRVQMTYTHRVRAVAVNPGVDAPLQRNQAAGMLNDRAVDVVDENLLGPHRALFSCWAPGLMKHVSVPGTRIDTWPNMPITPCRFNIQVQHVAGFLHVTLYCRHSSERVSIGLADELKFRAPDLASAIWRRRLSRPACPSGQFPKRATASVRPEPGSLPAACRVAASKHAHARCVRRRHASASLNCVAWILFFGTSPRARRPMSSRQLRNRARRLRRSSAHPAAPALARSS